MTRQTIRKELKTMSRSLIIKGLGVGFAAVMLAGMGYAQRGGGADYLTTGIDAQRTSWAKVDRFISKDEFQKGPFQLQWKLKVPIQREGAILGGTTSGGGLTKPLNVIATTNNTLTTVDNDTGVPGWVRHFDAAVSSTSTAVCPAGMTANAT